MKELILNNKKDFLKFLKSKFPLYHDSNIFLRDIHYGVMNYLEEKTKRTMKYLEAEKLTMEIVDEFEKQGIFKKMDSKTWLLNYAEFALPRPVPKPAAPAASAQPQPATK